MTGLSDPRAMARLAELLNRNQLLSSVQQSIQSSVWLSRRGAEKSVVGDGS